MFILRRLSTKRPVAPLYGPFSLSLSRTTPHIPRFTSLVYHPDSSKPVPHGPENYFVDGDDTPPPNAPLYRVDAASDAAQSAYEPPSGPWSRAGAGTAEYQTVSKDKPYDVPGDSGVKLQYDGEQKYVKDEGPEGSDRWGRKPE